MYGKRLWVREPSSGHSGHSQNYQIFQGGGGNVTAVNRKNNYNNLNKKKIERTTAGNLYVNLYLEGWQAGAHHPELDRSALERERL